MAESPSGIRLLTVEHKTAELEKDLTALVPRLAAEHKENSGRFDDLGDKIDAVGHKVDLTYDQALRTNGRMNKAEEALTDIQSWKDKMMGAWWAVSGLIAIGAWLLGKYAK